MESMKTRIEHIKEVVTEVGWCCACLLSVMIFENFEV